MVQENKSLLKSVVYLAVNCLNTIQIIWVQKITGFPLHKQVLFLTLISLFINTFYFFYKFLGSVNIISINKKFERRLFKFSFHLSFLVLVLYWSLRLLDPSTLAKNPYILPFELDILLHGANYLVNLLEHLIICRKSKDFDSFIDWKFILAFGMIYTLIVKAVFCLTGFAVYPLIEQMDVFLFILMNLGALLIIFVSDCVYHKISFHGYEYAHELKIK